MTFRTPNLDLPFIAPAQAQKHVTHNEAIRALDAVVQLSATSILDTPPSNPNDGERFIVGPNPNGEFLDHVDDIAAFQDGAWTFLTPQMGWRAYDNTAKDLYVFSDTGWTSILTEQTSQLSTDQFGINATADEINRLVVKSEASLFDHVGEGHQLKVNKANEDKTASLLFQSDYQGHAEMGLTGSNDFAVRVSPDGAQFSDVMRVDGYTGDVKFPNGTNRDMLLGTIDISGDGAEFYGFPNLMTIATEQASTALASGRIYFHAVFIDRPTEITGGLAVLTSGASSPNAVMRLGIFEIGEPSGGNWRVGNRIVDFGTQSASSAGGFDYTLSNPVVLQRGWYKFAVGVNGSGAVIRYLINYTPGLTQYAVTGTGESTIFRAAGPSRYCFMNDQDDAIENGFPSDWGSVTAVDIAATTFRNHMYVVPKFKHWNAT